MRLWEEQGDAPTNRHCPYCQRQISFGALLAGEDVDVDHVLPRHRTLDYSMANEVICCTPCNRKKGALTPFEAFGGTPEYAEILRSASALASNKRWRFQPNAMDRFESDEKDFLDRQLNETRYLARVTKFYLESVCSDVRVTPGRLTALLRGKWGLNNILSDSNLKNRTDHRHHAVDAAVIGLTDRRMLQEVATASARGVDGGRLVEKMPTPPDCPDFRAQIIRVVDKLVVWHKPDHHVAHGEMQGTSGALHNDTAYGIVEGPDAKGFSLVVSRKSLAELKNAEGLDGVADGKLKNDLKALWEGMRLAQPGCKWSEFVDKAARPGVVVANGVKRVRVRKKMSGLIYVRQAGEDVAYKAYKPDGNAYMDIFRRHDGRWEAETVTRFDANQPDFAPSWREKFGAAAFVMRLHINDLVAVGEGPGRKILRVVKTSHQTVTCAQTHEGGPLKKRDGDDNDPFKYIRKTVNSLREDGLRRLGVSELGHIRDNGPALCC